MTRIQERTPAPLARLKPVVRRQLAEVLLLFARTCGCVGWLVLCEMAVIV